MNCELIGGTPKIHWFISKSYFYIIFKFILEAVNFLVIEGNVVYLNMLEVTLTVHVRVVYVKIFF